MDDLHDLELLLTNSTSIITVETREEQRALELFKRAKAKRPLLQWTLTQGLSKLGERTDGQIYSREPRELLGLIRSTDRPTIYVLCDFHPFIEDPLHQRYIKDITLEPEKHTLVFLGHEIALPRDLVHLARSLSLSLPNRQKLRKIVLEEGRAWTSANNGKQVRANRKLVQRLIENLLGLPESDARRLARGAIANGGAITESDFPEIMRAKFELVSQGGVLSFEYDTAKFADVGGLSGLRRWLELRSPVFLGELNRPGLDRPKGVLLLGVQGCGKSLAAKAVAGLFHVPLLRLDFGALYNKFYGETEKNLRESLKQAELLSPCVLWIDEIEKGVSVSSSDGGTSKRILGTLLTWMAENQARVFIVATANSIESLPPELLRKGRLDEIFFVDLPKEEVRRTIFEIHLSKRSLDISSIDISEAVKASDGFSGAEIEQAVVASLYRAHAGKTDVVSTSLLLEELRATRPLSVVMAEMVAGLRTWAKNRTVPAD